MARFVAPVTFQDSVELWPELIPEGVAPKLEMTGGFGEFAGMELLPLQPKARNRPKLRVNMMGKHIRTCQLITCLVDIWILSFIFSFD
jgi:hypothetical protein